MIYQTPGLNITDPVILMENRLSAVVGGVVSATTNVAAAANVLTPTTWDSWRATALTGFVRVDFSPLFTVDSFGLVGHNLGTIGAGFAFGHRQAETDAWTYLPAVYPTDNSPILYLSPLIAARQFVAFALVAGSAPPVFGSLWGGRRLVLPSSVAPDYVRAPDAVTVEGEAAVSRGGHYLGATIRRRAGNLSAQINPIARAWADSNLPAFRRHYDERRAFFFASSPGVYPEDVAYGWRSDRAGELRPSIGAGGAFVRFGMELDFHAA